MKLSKTSQIFDYCGTAHYSIGFQQFHRWLLNFLNIQATLAFFEKIFLVIFSWIWNFYLEKKKHNYFRTEKLNQISGQ